MAEPTGADAVWVRASKLNQALAAVAELTAVVEHVRALHPKTGTTASGRGYCLVCLTLWPCETAATVQPRETS